MSDADASTILATGLGRVQGLRICRVTAANMLVMQTPVMTIATMAQNRQASGHFKQEPDVVSLEFYCLMYTGLFLITPHRGEAFG